MPSHFNLVQLFATLRTFACQAPLFVGFSRQEYWSGLPNPPPANLPNPVTEPMSLTSLELAGGFFITGNTWEAEEWVVNASAEDRWKEMISFKKIQSSIIEIENNLVLL